MAISKNKTIVSDLTYVTPLKESILKSGGTVVFVRDNLILATEISEEQYRDLLNNPYVDKIDVLPIKRYGDNISPYQEVVSQDVPISIDSVIVTNDAVVKPLNNLTTNTTTTSPRQNSLSGTVTSGCPTPDMNIKISPKRHMQAGELKEGQNIYTIHEKTNNLGYFKIKYLNKAMQQIVKVSFGYDFVTVSNSHKFLTENDEYISISDISVGTKLKTLKDLKEITEIVEIGFGTVINIEVEGAHTYIVNDIISHNKQQALDTPL
jgi:hypothetical protein